MLPEVEVHVALSQVAGHDHAHQSLLGVAVLAVGHAAVLGVVAGIIFSQRLLEQRAGIEVGLLQALEHDAHCVRLFVGDNLMRVRALVRRVG